MYISTSMITLPKHFCSFYFSRTNARMGRVDRNWTKSGERLFSHAGGLLVGELAQAPHYPET